MDDRPARWPWLVLVLVYLGLRLPALLAYAPTYDEPIYVGAGKHFVVRHETQAAALLYHPPLAYHLTSAPLWFVDTPLPAWDVKGHGSQVGLEVLYGSKTLGGTPLSPETVILLSRVPVLLFGLLGLPLCFGLGRRLAGDFAGWLAAAAWAVHPEVAAQSVQATTDLVAAVAALLLAHATMRHFHDAILSPEVARRSHVVLGATCGVAALSKHTLLVPIAMVVVWSLVLRFRRRMGGISQPRRPLLRFVVACAAGLAVLWAGYLFEVGPIAATGGPHEHAETIAKKTGLDAETVAHLAESVPVPAPTYWRSVADAFLDKARARSGTTWSGYLEGRWDYDGFLWYFPVALLVKTPTSLLALMILGVAGWWFFRARERVAADVCMAFFAVPFAVAVASRLNIGVRHLLPAAPFLLILGSAFLAILWGVAASRVRVVAAVLAVLLAAEWAANRFDPLPFANLPSGGQDRLFRHLADSNLEIGQDLWRLERWCEERGVESVDVLVHAPQGLPEREAALHPYLHPVDGADHVTLAASLLATPQTGEPPRRGLVAIGESVLVRPAYARLADVEPLARVGRTRIYRTAP